MTQPPPPIPFGPVPSNWTVVRGIELGMPVMGFDVRKADGICHHVNPVQFWQQAIPLLQENIRQMTGGLILPPGVSLPGNNGHRPPPPDPDAPPAAVADVPAELTDRDAAEIRDLRRDDPTTGT